MSRAARSAFGLGGVALLVMGISALALPGSFRTAPGWHFALRLFPIEAFGSIFVGLGGITLVAWVRHDVFPMRLAAAAVSAVALFLAFTQFVAWAHEHRSSPWGWELWLWISGWHVALAVGTLGRWADPDHR